MQLVSDEENTSVIEEVAAPPESEEKQDAPPVEQEVTPEPKRADQEYNFRELRKSRDALQEEVRELRSMFEQSKNPQPQEDDLAKLADDDIVTAKQAKSLAAKMAREVAGQVLREREAETVEDRVKIKFPDFDSICSKENIEVFKQNEPELAMSLSALAHDPYNQAVAAYKLLKKHGLGVSEEVVKNKQKAQENSRKPVSVQTVTKQSSAIGNAHQFENGLTPELRKQLWKEMQDARKMG